MPVSITQAEATVAIRAATDPDAIAAPVAAVVGYLFAAAEAMVELYAPNAPDAVHNAALIRLLGWMYEADPTDVRMGRAMQVSGAAPLLSQWRVHRAGAIGQAAEPPAPTPGAGLPPLPGSGHFILSVDDGELKWLAFPLPPS